MLLSFHMAEHVYRQFSAHFCEGIIKWDNLKLPTDRIYINEHRCDKNIVKIGHISISLELVMMIAK